jgi:uncharacterized protein (DUF427 family)
MRPEPLEPAPGQESVWDYPRPPRVEETDSHLCVVFNGVIIAETRDGKRVLETSHPPSYYFPPEDVSLSHLVEASGFTWCEWKGRANYYHVDVEDKRADRVAWSYHQPRGGFDVIKHHIAFYPGSMDACYVDGERAKPQPGGFYGGWITSDVVGPFKGGPGTRGW